MGFTVNLLPDTEKSKTELKDRTDQFISGYRLKHPINAYKDENLKGLFQSIYDKKFWRSLSTIDGHISYQACENDGRPDDIDKRRKKRAWAVKSFNYKELQELLDISVNTALLDPAEKRQCHIDVHTMLYGELIEKTDSLFHGAVTPELRKRLNNGRFWENIPYMQIDACFNRSGRAYYKIVQDVLLQGSKDLDAGFAKKGFKLAERGFDNRFMYHWFNLKLLSNKAVDKYGQFISSLNKYGMKDGFNPKELDHLEHLVAAYGVSLLSTRLLPRKPGEDPFASVPRFPNPKKVLTEKLKDSNIRHYFEKSDTVRGAIAWELQSHGYKYFAEALSVLPNPRGIIDKISPPNDTTRTQWYRDFMNLARMNPERLLEVMPVEKHKELKEILGKLYPVYAWQTLKGKESDKCYGKYLTIMADAYKTSISIGSIQTA